MKRSRDEHKFDDFNYDDINCNFNDLFSEEIKRNDFTENHNKTNNVIDLDYFLYNHKKVSFT